MTISLTPMFVWHRGATISLVTLLDILLLRSRFKMGRIHTGRIVATVKHAETFGDGSDEHLVSNAGGYVDFWVNSKGSVSPYVGETNPDPTPVRVRTLDHFLEKASNGLRINHLLTEWARVSHIPLCARSALGRIAGNGDATVGAISLRPSSARHDIATGTRQTSSGYVVDKSAAVYAALGVSYTRHVNLLAWLAVPGMFAHCPAFRCPNYTAKGVTPST